MRNAETDTIRSRPGSWRARADCSVKINGSPVSRTCRTRSSVGPASSSTMNSRGRWPTGASAGTPLAFSIARLTRITLLSGP